MKLLLIIATSAIGALDGAVADQPDIGKRIARRLLVWPTLATTKPIDYGETRERLMKLELGKATGDLLYFASYLNSDGTQQSMLAQWMVKIIEFRRDFASLLACPGSENRLNRALPDSRLRRRFFLGIRFPTAKRLNAFRRELLNLPRLSSDTVEPWFKVIRELLMVEHGDRPERVDALKSFGNYRRLKRQDRPQTAGAIEADARDAIITSFKGIFTTMVKRKPVS